MKRITLLINALSINQVLSIFSSILLLFIACNTKNAFSLTKEGMSVERLKISGELLQKPSTIKWLVLLLD